jgi:penicillin-binding protein 1A
MGSGRRKVGARHEPAFDAEPGPDLPVAAENNAAGAPEPRHRAARAQAESAAANDDSPTPQRPRGDRPAARRRRKRGGRGGGRGRSPVSRLIYWTLVLGLWAVITAAGTIAWVGSTLPPIQSLEVPKRPPKIEIVGLDGRILATRGEMAGTDVPIKVLPPYLPKAFIAIEDRRFYSHYGIDPIGLARAALANVARRGVSQGGSTITQQLAKNLFLTQERTLFRKLQELVLALWLERKFSKNEILELYLNRVYFGSGAYGVEAAAQRYFGKSARQVKIAEAAMLAGLVKSPSRLAPSRNPNGAERRAQAVLTAMAELGFVTETMATSALAQPARAIKPVGAGSVNYVADWILDVLDDLVGRVEQDLVVETSIDPVLQATAEKALVDELALKGAKLDVQQGAIVAMTPSGAVRALVGGRNYADSQYNRAVAAKRQPGSAFKPFVYLTAIERGLTPESVRDDKPIVLKGWKPENYTREYHGPVKLTQALALSLNTVSVRLTLEFGPVAVAKTAYRLGIASKLEANPSLALGTSEVSLIELTSAYAPFANGGDAITPHVIERVRSGAGKVLYARSSQELGQIIEARYVAMMNTMMRETLTIGTAQKAQLAGWTAAGKTGTSQDFRDAWFIGYTAHLVTGVWLGNDDSSPTKRATGGGLPVEIWSRIMKSAHQGVPVAGLLGLSGGPSLASALPPIGAPTLPAPIGGNQAGRPQPIDRGLDGWFLDRIFGRR